jgi:hypothetical protein
MNPPQAARTTPMKAMANPIAGRMRRKPPPKTTKSKPANRDASYAALRRLGLRWRVDDRRHFVTQQSVCKFLEFGPALRFSRTNRLADFRDQLFHSTLDSGDAGITGVRCRGGVAWGRKVVRSSLRGFHLKKGQQEEGQYRNGVNPGSCGRHGIRSMIYWKKIPTEVGN